MLGSTYGTCNTPHPPMRWHSLRVGNPATSSLRPPTTIGLTRPSSSSAGAWRKASHTSLWDAGPLQSNLETNSLAWAPPFVLYASGEVKPLQVGQPRTPDADSDFLEVNLYDFFFAIGAPVRSLAPDDSTVLETLWGPTSKPGRSSRLPARRPVIFKSTTKAVRAQW